MQAIRAAVAGRRIATSPSPWMVQQLRSKHKLGAREAELLSEDPALKEFKDTRPMASKMAMAGDAVIVLLGIGFLYETYYRWQAKWDEAQKS